MFQEREREKQETQTLGSPTGFALQVPRRLGGAAPNWEVTRKFGQVGKVSLHRIKVAYVFLKDILTSLLIPWSS